MKALLLAPKPREINSWMYGHTGIRETAEVFKDHRWAPAVGVYEADAFTKLYKRVLDLYEDTTYDAILLDPLTDAVTLAVHEILAPDKAESPGALPGKNSTIAFYGQLKYKLKGLVQALTGLASPDLPKPKHVLVAVHAQPTREEDLLGKETPEGSAKGIEFLGEALPMVEGGYRREIAGEFDIVGFTRVTHGTSLNPKTKKIERTTEYKVQLNADPERHAKISVVPRLEQVEVPNDMAEIFRVIEESGGVLRGGLIGLFVGPPGTGKSWLLGSIGKI